MALTDTQRAQVRKYLGWPARWWQTSSQLEQAMNALDQTAAELTEVTTMLTALADIDTRITAAYSRLKAMKVGSIELPGHGELLALRSEGRRYSNRLASKLGVPILSDAWSGGSGPNAYAAADRMVPSGSNYVKQG